MKNILSSLCLLFAVILIPAQNLLNVNSPEEFAKNSLEKAEKESEENKPLPYGEVKDRDILWSKIVWEVVDMNEKINQSYYHSNEGIAGISQKSLFDVLIESIKSENIKEIYVDDKFTTKTDYTSATSKFSVVDTSDWAKDKIAAGETITSDDLDFNELRSTDIKMFKVMGMWYIDKKLGELRYRPLGIAPMGPDMQAVNAGIVDDSYYDLFWVWYADARQVLHNSKVFSGRNTSADISFDDMLNARRFNSIIYKEQNMQGRAIKDYVVGDAEGQIEEYKRIKETIRDVEADMWQN